MPSSGAAEIKALLSLIGSAAQTALSAYAAYGVEVPSFYAFETHPLDLADDNLALKTAIRTLEGACYQLCATLAPPTHTIYKSATNSVRECLFFALEAKLADIISHQPNGMHVRQIANVVGAEEGKLDRILRRLSAENLFCEVSPHVYAPSRLTQPLLSNNVSSDLFFLPSMSYLPAAPAFYSTMMSPELGKSFESKDAAIMCSINSKIGLDKEKYRDFYQWVNDNPTVRQTFHRAMIGLDTVLGSRNVIYYYPWSKVKTVCDVGSGVGAFSLALAKMYPHLHITLLDLPEVIKQAKPVWEHEYPEALQHGSGQQQITFSSCDFLNKVNVPNQDVYYLRNILHNWPDNECRTILRNIRENMRGNPNSRILIHDFVIQHGLLPQLAKTSLGSRFARTTDVPSQTAPWPLASNYGVGNAAMYNMDMIMLLCFNGQERLLEKTIKIAGEAGLEFIRVWDIGETPLVELRVADANKKSRL